LNFQSDGESFELTNNTDGSSSVFVWDYEHASSLSLSKIEGESQAISNEKYQIQILFIKLLLV